MNDDTYGPAWRVTTAALGVGAIVLGVLFVRWIDFPTIFAVPAAFSWRGGSRRGVWQVVGALHVPFLFAVFTACMLWMTIVKAPSWDVRGAVVPLLLLGVGVTAYLGRGGLRYLDASARKNERDA